MEEKGLWETANTPMKVFVVIDYQRIVYSPRNAEKVIDVTVCKDYLEARRVFKDLVKGLKEMIEGQEECFSCEENERYFYMIDNSDEKNSEYELQIEQKEVKSYD